MRNKSSQLFFNILYLILSPFVINNVNGQTASVEYHTTEAVACWDVPDVSTHIASMYHADVQVVESYVEAAVNLERHSGIAASVVIAIAIHESSFNSYLFKTQAIHLA